MATKAYHPPKLIFFISNAALVAISKIFPIDSRRRQGVDSAFLE